ncbi:hypothetical protein K1W54_26565 [Micromonospora sp. CPCC 205371]|nr:hypothetical protein [Micromonospora sp. CPCC 205371]
MSVTETLLVFVVIPAAIVLVIAGLALLGGGRGGKRYRPGRSFDFAPVWFLSAPEQLAGSPATSLHELPAGSAGSRELPAGSAGSRELPAGSAGAANKELATAPAVTTKGATGGASDRW